jgi:hypothetical protein
VPDDAVIEAARAIRPYLPELVPGEAEAIDGELATLLASLPDDPAAPGKIEQRLLSPKPLLEWTATFLDGGEPPDVKELRTAVEERYAGLPGHGDPPPLPRKYVCPSGDYVRYRRGGEPLPPCPSDGLALVPADRDG